MSTKEYPLDHIQALHLLTGDEPVKLEDAEGDFYWREGDKVIHVDYNHFKNRMNYIGFITIIKDTYLRIYEPPKPEKLEPVELCEELVKHIGGHNGFAYKLYGLLIAQALRMAREEREAEKKGEGK